MSTREFFANIFLYFECSSWLRKTFSQSAKLLTIAQVSKVRKIVDSGQFRQTPKANRKSRVKSGLVCRLRMNSFFLHFFPTFHFFKSNHHLSNWESTNPEKLNKFPLRFGSDFEPLCGSPVREVRGHRAIWQRRSVTSYDDRRLDRLRQAEN